VASVIIAPATAHAPVSFCTAIKIQQQNYIVLQVRLFPSSIVIWCNDSFIKSYRNINYNTTGRLRKGSSSSRQTGHNNVT